jgi:hypothetical protein
MPTPIRRNWFLVLALAAQAALAQAAAPLPEFTPEEVGLSSARLGRMDATMQRAIDSGKLPGGVVLIARDGQLVQK